MHLQVILFVIDCAIFYTNLHELLRQFKSWTNWVNSGKVHIFWEGHKILRNLHLTFVLCSASQKWGEDFAIFCGLLRIYKLYGYARKARYNRSFNLQIESHPNRWHYPLMIYLRPHSTLKGNKLDCIGCSFTGYLWEILLHCWSSKEAMAGW